MEDEQPRGAGLRVEVVEGDLVAVGGREPLAPVGDEVSGPDEVPPDRLEVGPGEPPGPPEGGPAVGVRAAQSRPGGFSGPRGRQPARSDARRYSRRILAMFSIEMLFGQAASHSPWFEQSPKPSASIWSTMPSTRDVRSGCPCGSSER